MIEHHVTDQLLMAYSAGTLPEAFGLVVATHVSMCDECRARMESFDALGGSVLADAPQHDEVSMDADAFESTLSMIKRGPKDPIEIAPRKQSDVPAPLAEYLGGGLDSVRWRPVGMGVRQAILRTSKEATARLLYIPAGVAVPDHCHRGTELTLVIKGAFEDEFDRFGPGDLEVADEEMVHTPVASKDGPCICLAATDAPLRFSGLIPRLAQSFLRM